MKLQNINLILTLIVLLFLTGCKEEDGYDLNKSYVFYDYVKEVKNPDSYKYRVVYPMIIRVKSNGKVLDEKRYELYFNDLGTAAQNYTVAIASSGMDLDLEWEFLTDQIPNDYVLTVAIKAMRGTDIYDYLPDSSRKEVWTGFPKVGDKYGNDLFWVKREKDNLLKVHSYKVNPDKDYFQTRGIELSIRKMMAYKIFERTADGEKEIYVDGETEKIWAPSVNIRFYSFGQQISEDTWPIIQH